MIKNDIFTLSFVLFISYITTTLVISGNDIGINRFVIIPIVFGFNCLIVLFREVNQRSKE